MDQRMRDALTHPSIHTVSSKGLHADAWNLAVGKGEHTFHEGNQRHPRDEHVWTLRRNGLDITARLIPRILLPDWWSVKIEERGNVLLYFTQDKWIEKPRWWAWRALRGRLGL